MEVCLADYFYHRGTRAGVGQVHRIQAVDRLADDPAHQVGIQTGGMVNRQQAEPFHRRKLQNQEKEIELRNRWTETLKDCL